MDLNKKCEKCGHRMVDHFPHGKDRLCPEVIIDLRPFDDLESKIRKMRAALEAADACFDALDPRQPSGMSDAETASMFNATREAVRLALE